MVVYYTWTIETMGVKRRKPPLYGSFLFLINAPQSFYKKEVKRWSDLSRIINHKIIISSPLNNLFEVPRFNYVCVF